ncbi:hypothetical protein TREES_T100015881 [Tupaia chinensis]|uniref:Uncharacterized protein n=1 Tax=Tupaia chinensis TaxID=246437 RepID=L9L1U0_TUPCH|nr:hypothetical protein TREES_T100015881 [Tupaia chinensis]
MAGARLALQSERDTRACHTSGVSCFIKQPQRTRSGHLLLQFPWVQVECAAAAAGGTADRQAREDLAREDTVGGSSLGQTTGSRVTQKSTSTSDDLGRLQGSTIPSVGILMAQLCWAWPVSTESPYSGSR